jgi:HEXXH motif-containing protein
MLTNEITQLVEDIGSGFGRPDTLLRLRQGQLEKRLLQLKMLLSHAASRHPDDLERSGLTAAFDRLKAAQRERPAEISELLLYPNLGVWLVHCLRRITLDGQSKEPLWADFGYLGWLVAADLIRAGTTGTVTLVVRDGAVMLPGLGLARLAPPGVSGHCELQHRDSRIRLAFGAEALAITSVEEDEDPRWLPLRRIGTAFSGGRPVYLDDIDPFRDLYDPYTTAQLGHESPRLTTGEVARWRQAYEGALEILGRDYGAYAAAMSQGLQAIVPLTAEPILIGVSNTSFDAFGGINMSAAAGPHQFALTLIHEYQHAKLSMLTDLVQLHEPSSAKNLYAPWRDDARPLSGLLQGIYAHVGVTDFWCIHRRTTDRDTRLAHVEFARWRVQVDRALQEVAASPLLTTEGRLFVAALTDTVRHWVVEEVPPEAEALARESSTGHWVAWRVRNLRIEPSGMDELCRRWREGSPAGHLPASVPAKAAAVPKDYRSRLLPTYLKRLGSSSTGIADPAGSQAADVAYADRDFANALTLYVEELADGPSHPQPWAGIALCLTHLQSESALWPLLDRGEVVAGVYHRLMAEGQSCDILKLVSWLADASSSE